MQAVKAGRHGTSARTIVAWEAVLRDAGVSAFHATDFYACRGEFKNWTLNDDRHVVFAERFTAVAEEAGLIGFALGLDGAAYAELVAPEAVREDRRHRMTHPRTFAVMSSLAAVGDFLVKTPDRTRGGIRAVFEQEQGAGRFRDFFEESNTRRERWTYWFESFATGPKSLIPLQIADLLAHEAWRRVKEVQAENPRPIRKSLDRMLVGGRIDVRWHGREHCVDSAKRIREVLVLYPNGLAPADAGL